MPPPRSLLRAQVQKPAHVARAWSCGTETTKAARMSVAFFLLTFTERAKASAMAPSPKLA